MTPAEQFIDHWRDRLAGMALRGLALDTDQRPLGPHTAGAYALSLPEKVDELLARMFSHAEKLLDKPLAAKAATPPVNGVQQQRPLAQSGPEARRP